MAKFNFNKKKRTSIGCGLYKAKAIKKKKNPSPKQLRLLQQPESIDLTATSMANEITILTDEVALIQDRNFEFKEQYGCVITKRRMLELESEGRAGWLSDEIIDYYLEMLCAKVPDCQAMSAAFYHSQIVRDRSLSRRNQDFFNNRLMFIPLIRPNHWTLVVINNQQHQIDYYDSLDCQPYPQEVTAYIKRALESLGRRFEEERWTIRRNLHYPKQNNGFDCGAFLLQYAKHIALGQEMQFTQVNN